MPGQIDQILGMLKRGSGTPLDPRGVPMISAEGKNQYVPGTETFSGPMGQTTTFYFPPFEKWVYDTTGMNPKDLPPDVVSGLYSQWAQARQAALEAKAAPELGLQTRSGIPLGGGMFGGR